MSISMLLWFFAVSGATLALLLAATSGVLWRRRKLLADAAAALFLFGAVFVWSDVLQPLLYALMSLTSLFGVIYAARLHIDRLHHYHLKHTTVSGAVFVYCVSLALFVLGALFNNFDWLLTVAVFAAFGWSLVVIGQLAWAKHGYRRHGPVDKLTEKEMPTVTLAIPARNENHALTDSLQAAISSDYPKLEILVLDDCSHDRTSQLIRSFAHDGVRFVQGKEPADGWLGKNQAMQTLAEHAHGEYIIFSGVDTKIARHTITELVSYLVTHHIDMVSVMSQRKDKQHPSAFFQQLRYYWQVSLPASKYRVPVASSLWAIKTETLQNLGGFGSAKNNVMPETSFARRLHLTDLYRFTISDEAIGVNSEKKWSSQIETALRVIYPANRRQPLVAFGAVVSLLALIAPYAYTAFALLRSEPPEELQVLVVGLAMLTSALLSVGYAFYLKLSSPRIWPVGLVAFPFLLIQEIVLVLLSMYQYEFGEVNWKGRNVCYPVIGQPNAADHESKARN